jgi:hypothetical protein
MPGGVGERQTDDESGLSAAHARTYGWMRLLGRGALGRPRRRRGLGRPANGRCRSDRARPRGADTASALRKRSCAASPTGGSQR